MATQPRTARRDTAPQAASPRPVLDLKDAVALIVGIIVGAGIFKAPSLVAKFSGSVEIMMAAWVIGGVVSILGALCYAEIATSHPNAGGEYHFLERAFGGDVARLFAWSRMLPVSGLLLAVMGGAALLGVNATNAMLQQSVPDEWRGRVIGVYSMSFAGTAPIGGLLAGWLAEHIGLTATLTLNGLIIVAVGLLGRWRLRNHPEALRGIMKSLSR